jgi:RNA polymerase sigma factor (sigma-70 family)
MTASECTKSEKVQLRALTIPRDAVSEEQESALLRRALLQLPEEKRELILLSRFQELKYEEIGKLLGCDANTVKVRVFRAMKELKEALDHLQRPPGRVRPQEGARYDM